MARTPGSCLVLLLLAVLLACAGPAWGSGDARSLSYKFNITPKGQPWCEIVGQFNGNTFLHYTCGSDNVKLISVLGMNATQAWNQHRDTLKNLVEELRKICLDIEPEIITASGPLSLQSSMMCTQESSGHNNASWVFALDGQDFLHLDSMNNSWTELHPHSGPLRKALDGERKLLVMTSTGDCVNWLPQVSGIQDEVLDRKAAPITVPAPATSTPATTSASPTKTADWFKPWTIFLIVSMIVIFLIICIICYIYRNRRCCSKAPGSVV